MRNAYEVLVENPEGKIPLGKPMYIWYDNIRMDPREIGGAGSWLRLGTIGGLL
jgi:hypothetical protein